MLQCGTADVAQHVVAHCLCKHLPVALVDPAPVVTRAASLPPPLSLVEEGSQVTDELVGRSIVDSCVSLPIVVGLAVVGDLLVRVR